jgi:hypothetical protein
LFIEFAGGGNNFELSFLFQVLKEENDNLVLKSKINPDS